MAETEKHSVNENVKEEEFLAWMKEAEKELDNMSWDPDPDMEADFLFPENMGAEHE